MNGRDVRRNSPSLLAEALQNAHFHGAPTSCLDQRSRNFSSTDGRHATASLVAFTGRALMIFRAGLALKTVGSFVNGLMPLRAFTAGFLMTTNLANPGTTKAPVFLSSR